MKYTKGRRKYILLALSIVALAITLWTQEVVAWSSDQTITYGSVIRIVHKLTGKALASGTDSYTHAGSSKQHAVYATAGKDESQYWVIKGPHSGDRFNAHLGRPVRKGAVVRFEHLQTGRNLHSHRSRSPATRQLEVTTYGSGGVGDHKDNYEVDYVWAGSRGTLVNGCVARFLHRDTKHMLHSHEAEFQAGKQEVTGHHNHDENDWFVLEYVSGPQDNAITKERWQNQRGGTLNYNTLIWIDTLSTGLDDYEASSAHESINHRQNNRRLWTHGGSRHANEDSVEPHRHVEILVGPWSDGRARHRAMTYFIIQNVDDFLKTGPVSFGDTFKILSVYAGHGYKGMSGDLNPFKIWWVSNNSRWGLPYRELVVSHPESDSTKDARAHFKLEPIFPGLSGQVYQNDAVRIRNLGYNQGLLWTNGGSRLGKSYFEILVNNNDDKWGKDNDDMKESREHLFGRYCLHQVEKDLVPGDARGDFDAIAAKLQSMLGEASAKQQAAAEEAKRKQAETARAESELLAAAAKAEFEKSQEEAAEKLAEAEKKGAEAKKQAEEEIKQTQADATKVLEEAKAKAEDDKKLVEDATKAKYDATAAEVQRKLDEAEALALELERFAHLPVGFVEVPGKAKQLAVSLVEEGKGKNKKAIIHAWAVGVDDKLMSWIPGAEGLNPWVAHVAKDEAGKEIAKFKSVWIGEDKTVYAIADDGKAYVYDYPGEAKVPAPGTVERKLREAKHKKAKKGKKAKKDKKDTKDKKKPEKKAGKKGKKKKGADPEKIEAGGAGAPAAPVPAATKGETPVAAESVATAEETPVAAPVAPEEKTPDAVESTAPAEKTSAAESVATVEKTSAAAESVATAEETPAAAPTATE